MNAVCVCVCVCVLVCTRACACADIVLYLVRGVVGTIGVLINNGGCMSSVLG